MKKWPLYIAAVLLTMGFGFLPFSGTDVGELQPVELLRICADGATVTVQTDTGDSGSGENLPAAFDDLKATTAAKVFLETADYLIINREAQRLLPDMHRYLRPACALCLEDGETEPEKAAAFLKMHKPDTSLQDWKTGESKIPVLQTENGRYRLVP